MFLAILGWLFIAIWGATGFLPFLLISWGIFTNKIIFNKSQDGVGYLISLLPWTFIVPLYFFESLSVIFILKIIIEMINNKKLVLDKKMIIFSLLGLTSILISALRENTDFVYTIILILFYICFILLLINHQIGYNFLLITELFNISTIISSFVGSNLDNFSHFIRLEDFYGINFIETEGRFSGLEGDPNFYSFLIMFGISLLVWSLQNFNIGNKKILYYFAILALSIFGFSTLSVTFFIIFFIFWGVLIITSLKSFKKTLLILVIIAVMLGTSSYWIPQLNLLLGDTYALRFESLFSRKNSFDAYEILNKVSNNRLQIWILYLSGWSEGFTSIFFGKGSMASESFSSHNTFIRHLYMYGIFGCVSFALLIGNYRKLIKNKIRVRKSNLIFGLISFVVIFYMSFLDFYRYNALPKLFFVIFIILNLNFSTKLKN